MSRDSRLLITLLSVIFLTTPIQTVAISPRKDPASGKVRVLHIGEPVGEPGPYRFMEQDPFLSMTPVQATTAWYGIEVIRRSLRMYLPRSYWDLVSRQDVIILSDANRGLFSPIMLKWF